MSDDFYDSVRTYRCDRLNEEYTRIHHPSGLRVLVCSKPMHSVSAMLVVGFGAQDTCFTTEKDGFHRYPQGVAHYLEHQLFTDEDGGSVDEQFSSLGVDVNAWTNHERTAYTISTAEHACEAIKALLRFVTHPTFTDASVEKERSIIAQEICMVEDDPWEALYRRSMSSLFPHHPTAKGICGTLETVKKISAEMLYRCYHAFYLPQNMCLTVCGNISAESVMHIVNRVMPNGAAPKSLPLRGTMGEYDHRTPVKRNSRGKANVSKPIFRIAWRDDDYPSTPEQRMERDVCMDILSEILFSRAGVFYNRLVNEGLITSTYSYGYSSMMNAAYHSISGESDDPEGVYRVYCEVLEQFRKTGFAFSDFERNRRVFYAGFVAEFDDTDNIADLLEEAEQEHVGVFDKLAVIDALTLQQMQKIFSCALGLDKTNLSVLYPRK